MIEVRSQGLYCPLGDFYIDPWRPVERAVITHGHSDHARSGNKFYISTPQSEGILRSRLGESIKLKTFRYGEDFELGECKVSLHSAGHVLGSAQVRIEANGEVWVVSGDYKRTPDRSCDPFEVVKCDVFISEATFALPVYSWPKTEDLMGDIFNWWSSYTSGPTLIFAYAFGKTQRLLAELAQLTDKIVYLHGACQELTEIYRHQNIKMLPTRLVSEMDKTYSFAGDLILAPPSAYRSQWMKRFKNPQTAFASGWMQIRGNRRRRGFERGFVMSDHADWKGLIQTIRECGAKQVYLTHGNTEVLQRYLREELGQLAHPLSTRYEGEVES